MIERYALYEIDKLRDRFDLPGGVPKGVKMRYNVQPAQSVPVILQRDGTRMMKLMQWGFVPQNAKDTNSIFRYKTFVARTEDVFNTVMWDRSISSRRCLVPVNGFYIWSKTADAKVPYYIQVKDRPLVALAGIYSSWTNSDGVELDMVSIITTRANADVDSLTERLPVIIQQDMEDIWLNAEVGDVSSLYEVMRVAPDGTLISHQVSDAIFSKKTDKPELILPLNS